MTIQKLQADLQDAKNGVSLLQEDTMSKVNIKSDEFSTEKVIDIVR